MHPQSPLPSVYIGHCEADGPAAKRLAMTLRDQYGIEVWLEDWQVDLGDVAALKRDAAIAQAKIFLVMLSKAALEDGWMSEQYAAILSQAVERKGRLAIPVLNGIPSEQVPRFLAIRKAAPITAVDAIARAIQRCLGVDSAANNSELATTVQSHHRIAEPARRTEDPEPNDEFFDELARVYWNADEAKLLVLRAGLSRPDVPNFTSSNVFWGFIRLAIQDGKFINGIGALADATAKSFPGNEIFARHRSPSS